MLNSVIMVLVVLVAMAMIIVMILLFAVRSVNVALHFGPELVDAILVHVPFDVVFF